MTPFDPETTFDPNKAAAPDSGLFGLSTPAGAAGVHVIGVPFDATASYRKGAHLGPEAVLRASHQVDLYDVATGRPYEAGIALLDEDARIAEWNQTASALADRVIEAGGYRPEDGDESGLAVALERVNAIGTHLNGVVYGAAGASLAGGVLPVVLGGDHSVPFGAIQAASEQHRGMGILHFDAHADLRQAYEGFTWSHASIMENVTRRLDGVSRVVQVGIRDLCEEEVERIESSNGRIQTLYDRDWQNARLEGQNLRELAHRWIADLPQDVWISFDVDGLDPSLCPNTGTPVPGGLDWAGASLWLDELVRSGRRVVGLDLCEVSPGPQARSGPATPAEDSWDAMVGARLLYRLIGTALATR